MVSLVSQKGIQLTTQNWLDLNEYSAKYKISLSTLRRRIKFSEVENFFRDGKYWVPDQKIAKNARVRGRAEPQPTEVLTKPEVKEQKNKEQNIELSELIGELKSAYVSVLHEKENQITQLKEEITDLKTLVKILESENERLQQSPPPSMQTSKITTQPPASELLSLNKNEWKLGDLDF